MSNTVGVQLRRDRLNPVALHATQARQILATTREDQVTIVNPQAYLSNNIEWTPWFRTLAGLRYDYFRFDVDGDLFVNSGEKSDSQVSPKISAIFGPWAQTELFLNWGEGLHSNDARGTTKRIDPKTGELVQPVTPVVSTYGYEAGLRTQPLPGLNTTLAVWALEQDSELLFIGDAGTTEASRASKRSGVEWLVQYVPTSWLAMDLALAFTRARFTEFDPAGDRISGPARPGRGPVASCRGSDRRRNLNGGSREPWRGGSVLRVTPARRARREHRGPPLPSGGTEDLQGERVGGVLTRKWTEAMPGISNVVVNGGPARTPDKARSTLS